MASKKTLCSLALIVIFNLFTCINAIDTITQTQFLSDTKNEALLSSDGNFKLGFFSPGDSISRYVGIWFNKVSKQTVVWVANRDTPLKNSSGIFKIADDGNLAVFDKNGHSLLWTTNISNMPTINSTAKLLPSGNLVLFAKNESGNTEIVVWQSFDYPTDTILPGMKFGMNRRTGLNQVLTAWKSSQDPAQGDFSIGLDMHSSPQYFLYKDSAPYWRGGPWNGRTLNGIPDIETRLRTYEVDCRDKIGLFNYNYINNQDEVYITFNVSSTSLFSIIVLEAAGFVKRLMWRENSREWARFWVEPENTCDQYARCGDSSMCNANNVMSCTCLPGFKPMAPQDWYIRCVEKRKFQCGKGEGEGFLKLAHVKIPDAKMARVYENMSLHECEMECLRNCSCKGYASTDINIGLGCLAWYGELNDMQQYTEDGQDFYLRVDARELEPNADKSKKGKSVAIIVAISVASALIIFALIGWFANWMKKSRAK